MKKLISFLLLVFLAIFPVIAKTQELKVAMYPLEGFFNVEANGTYSGYGIDFFNRIEELSDFSFSYVVCNSWSETRDKLINGDVDIRVPVEEPVNKNPNYQYSSEDVLQTFYTIMTLNEPTDLAFKDYEQIATLEFGIVRGAIEATKINEYFDDFEINKDKLLFYDDYNYCYNALKKGEIDGVITNIMDYTPDLKVIKKFANINNYLVMRVSDNRFWELDVAISQLKISDPNFLAQLNKKWFPERINYSYTSSELDVILNKELVIAFDRQVLPLINKDAKTNTYRGLIVDLVNQICKEIGIASYRFTIDLNENYDVLVTSDLFATKSEVVNSLNFLSLPLAMIKNPTNSGELKHYGVLGLKDNIKSSLANNNYNYVDYSEFDNSLLAFERLKNGQIDTLFGNLLAINYYLQKPQYNDFSINLVPNNYENFYFKFTNSSYLVPQIFNKGVLNLSSATKKLIIDSYSLKANSYSLTFSDLVYQNRLWILGVVVFLLMLGVCFVVVFKIKAKCYLTVSKNNEEFTSANKAKADFLSRVSHDLRTPLNTIIGLSELATDNTKLDTTTEEYLSEIKASGKFILCLINDILDMSIIEANKVVLKLETLNLHKFVAIVSRMFTPLAKEKNINFVVTDDFAIDSIRIDVNRFQQIIFNFISNAIKFTPNEGLVEFDCSSLFISEGNCLIQFSIRDNGIGMSKEFEKDMYEPFSQEGRINAEGSGLGLSINAHLIKLMNGIISCDSEINKGTTFSVAIPALISGQAHEPVLEDLNYIDYELLKGKRILICEDHPLNAKIESQLLTRVGIVSEVAENGKIGFDKYCEHSEGYYDAIFMDIRMPVLDGLVTTSLIRSSYRSDAKDIIIIALTADASQEDVRKSKEMGMNNHLAKPIESAVLYHVLTVELQKKYGKK
ncbi:MAG: response regulator [Spirochaetales bacterium]|nr:response regulator [Spirochaetales bacterium]